MRHNLAPYASSYKYLICNIFKFVKKQKKKTNKLITISYEPKNHEYCGSIAQTISIMFNNYNKQKYMYINSQ